MGRNNDDARLISVENSDNQTKINFTLTLRFFIMTCAHMHSSRKRTISICNLSERYLWAEERSQIDIVPYFFGTSQFRSKNLKLANTDVC